MKSFPIIKHTTSSQIKDVKWSPFYATIFACLLENGQAVIFNLALDKFVPKCIQSLVDTAEDAQPPKNSISFCRSNSRLILMCVNGRDVITFKIPESMISGTASSSHNDQHSRNRQHSPGKQMTSNAITQTPKLDGDYINSEKSKLSRILGLVDV